MEAQQEKPKRWLDFTINVQSLIVSMILAVVAGVGIYLSVITDVKALQSKALTYDERFARTDAAIERQRQETTEKLNAIGQNVEKIRDYLLDNAAGQRPDIKRWTR